jgi:hypothetical protein
LVGKYQSHEPNLISKAWKYLFAGYKGGFITGTELNLNSDSTFHMTTCGNILTGERTFYNDTLRLTYLSNQFKNDSLQIHGFEGKSPTFSKEPQLIPVETRRLVFSEAYLLEVKKSKLMMS